MASTVTRRPLPALVALLALLLLTGLVWWRVLNRSSGASPQTSRTPCTPATSSAPAPRATLPAPRSIAIRVLNSTDRSGIAGKVQDILVHDGFQSRKPAGNDDKHQGKITSVAEIRYGPSTKDAAKLLRYYLPGAQLVRTKRTSSTVVISLGKKYSGVAKPAHVEAALQARSLVTSGAPSPTPTPTRSSNC